VVDALVADLKRNGGGAETFREIIQIQIVHGSSPSLGGVRSSAGCTVRGEVVRN
jgi:hypothetical protein